MKLASCVMLLVLSGCYDRLPADGALRCNTQSAKMCPTNFYCADDGACWRLGHSPMNPGDDLSVGGLDLATGEFDLSGDKSCTADVCAGNTLRVCSAMNMYQDTVCPLGCSSTGGPHCSALVPQTPVAPADLDAAGLVAIDLTVATILHGDTGAIDGVRNANVNPAMREINNGIAFHVVNGIGIFSFQSLKIEDGLVVHVAGPNPIAIASATDVELIGQIEARICPGGGVGGASPATTGQNGTGQGFGSTASQTSCSGGGAGHGDKGGHGSTDMAMPTDGAGGAIYDGASLSPLHGGSSGAAGTAGSGGATTAGTGGAGGGALQIAAGHAVYFGGGAQPGGVNAGGCGGTQGSGAGTSGSGGGGGGSGGAILVESPMIEFRVNGALAANGGGGGSFAGSGSASYNGGDGSLSTMRSAGGSGGGGRGGAAGATIGESFDFGAGVAGGGGGGVGRIRLNSANGATLPASYILSPGFNDLNALGQAVSTQGTIAIQ